MILTKGNINEINIDLFIEQKILSDQLDSILIIVPTNRKLRDLKKKIIDNFIHKPVSKINIETLTTFSTKLLREYIGFTPLSEAAATVLIKRTADELELSYFSYYNKGIPFGTLDKIKNVISEYKKHGISPSDLIREADKLIGGEKNKALDIANIYKVYLERSKKLTALDIGDIYSLLLDLDKKFAAELFNNIYNHVEMVILDGFDEFTNQEIKIIDIISNIVDANLIINFDFYQKNKYLFSHLNQIHLNLLKHGFRKISDTTPMEISGFRNFIRSELFNENKEGLYSRYKNRVFKTKHTNRNREAEFIAKTIKNLILNEKVEPENICVAFNIIGNYSSLIRDIFSEYGIPINLTDRITLKSSQPVIAAISLLELIENDFNYHDLMRVLTNGFLEFEDIDLNNLIFVATELKITRGLKNWDLSVKDAVKLLDFNADISNNAKLIIIKKYEKAAEDIRKISKLLLPFRGKNTKEEFFANFKKLLLKLKLPSIVSDNSHGREEEFIKSITVLLQTLNEVLLLIHEENAEKKYSLHFFIDQIKTISNWARFNIKEKSDYGVLVTSVNEIRGLKFDILFLGGMCDGDFPTKYFPEIFFSGSFQKKEQFHQTEERYHFYQALCSWENLLYLTIPQNDMVKELVESTFITDISKIIDFSVPESEFKNTVFTDQQLQVAYSENKNNKRLTKLITKRKIDISKLDENIFIRNQRTELPFADNKYSGFIGTDDKEILNFLKSNSENDFSVSQLETFAKCPYKYFAERILKLKTLEEPSDEAEPIELGNVLHSILYDFYTRIVDEKIPIIQIGSEQFNELKKILFEIAEDKINKLNLSSPLAFFEREKILGIEGKKENSILHKFLEFEIDNLGEFKPSLFEFTFDNFFLENDKTEVTPFSVNKVKLRGKIDRIDIDDENQFFNIIDYKLKGRKPTVQELKKGLSLQLPTYLMAGEHFLKNIHNKDVHGNKMIIYSLDFKEDNFGPKPIIITGKKTLDSGEIKKLNEDLLLSSKEKIFEYHRNITRGKFNLSELEDRKEKVCKYCNFKALCRVQEVFGV